MTAGATRLVQGLTVGFFCAAISAPLITWLIHGVPGARNLPEERPAAPFPPPPTDGRTFSAWPRAFETWFGDALGGRETILRARNREWILGFGISPTPSVYIGADRWIFLSEGREFETHRGAAPASRHEIEAWVAAVRARANFCRAHGAEYLFALAPDKTHVYPERHAFALERIGPSRADQFVAALALEPELEAHFVDLRASQRTAALADAPGDHAYFPYGSHWTDRGTVAAMEVLLARIRALPALARCPPFSAADVVYQARGYSGDNWGGRLYLGAEMQAEERVIASIRGPLATLDVAASNLAINKAVMNSDDPTLPRILMFHDSFGLGARKFIARTASHSVTLWDFFQPALVESVKPELVIDLYVERIFARLPFDNLPEQGRFAERLFESSSETLSVLDPARDTARLARRGGIESEFVADDGDGAIRLRWLKPTSLAELPAAMLPDAAQVIVRLDVELPEPADANFHFQTEETRTYTRANSITKILPAGRSFVYVHLAVPNIRGPLVFRLNRSVDVMLHGAESRLLKP